MKRLLRQEQGFSLMLSLITLVVMLTLSMALGKIVQYVGRESVFQKRLAQSQMIAEAGQEDALYQLRLDPNTRTGFTKTFGGGSYTVSYSTDTPPWVTVAGKSVAIPFFGTAHTTLRAQSQITTSSSTDCTTYSAAATVIHGYIDAYDSAVSTNPSSFGFGGKFCSNTTFVTRNHGIGIITVNGHVEYFSGAAPTASTIGGTVTKSTFTRTLPTHDGTSFVLANNNGNLSPLYYTAATKALIIPVNNTCRMSPGTYYLNALTVNGNLRVDNTTATIVIYLNANFTLPNRGGGHNGEITNLSGIPSRLAIYPQGNRTISLQSKAPLHAVIEGSTSNITVSQTLFGNLVGRNITIQNPNTFHFDLQTGPASVPSRVSWTLGSWSANPQ